MNNEFECSETKDVLQAFIITALVDMFDIIKRVV